MVSLEQVKLLETKVAKAIDFVSRVTDENSLLKGTLESYRKRIDELEGLVQRFKDEQGRIEEGILSALERLNQFEDAIGAAIGDAAGRNPSPARASEKAPVEKEEPAPEKKRQEEEATASPEESGSAAGDEGPEEEPPSFGESPPEEDESDEAIMAALEAEEAATKAEQDLPPSGHTDSEELDIF
jgi:hypothetical protein